MILSGILDRSWQDIRYSLRALRRGRGFTATAVLTLALGVGATTAIFAVIHAVLLEPLPYAEPDRLVRVTGGATVARFEAIREARCFRGAGAYAVFTETVTLAGVDGAEALKGARVSANFLQILGIQPLRGRSFRPDDEQPGVQVAMISERLWRRRFGGDPGLIGGAARMAAAPYTIIGVLPGGFEFPSADLDVWRPWQPDVLPLQSRLNSPVLAVFGRLKTGVSLATASAELSVANRRYSEAHPGRLDARPAHRTEPVIPWKEQVVGNVRSTLWILFGAVALLLMITCANVGNLLLTRAASRAQEFAVRAALGAGRGRLAGQLLAESLLLAVAGGGLGLLFAQWCLRGLLALPGLEVPRLREISLDGGVVAFALVITIGAAVLIGMAPSLGATRLDLARAMKAGGEAPDSDRRGQMRLWLRPRGVLVAGQVALSIVLLIGAVLLLGSLARLWRVNPGFQPDHLLTMRITVPQNRHEELVRRVEALPGVRAAAVTLTLPTTGFAGTPVLAAGQPLSPLNERPIAVLQTVTPGYFRTMGIPLRRGRDFTPHDTSSAPLVAIINESLARHFWPSYPKGEDPVGHYILAGASPAPIQVIGIAADVRQGGLADEAAAGLYRPRAQTPPMSAMFAVRTDGDPLSFVNAIRAEVAALDRDQAVSAVKTMEGVIDGSEGQRSSAAILLSLFAAAGLLLAVVGVYGVVAYSVAQRTREIGIRRAVGAEPGDIFRLVLSQGLSVAVVGAVFGLAGAFVSTRLVQSLLFQTSPTDPITFAGVTALLLGVAVLASYIPARRALRISPSAALRRQ